MNANLQIIITTPPVALVKTWCQLHKGAASKINTHAKKMLLKSFGSMRGVVEFVHANNIKLK